MNRFKTKQLTFDPHVHIHKQHYSYFEKIEHISEMWLNLLNVFDNTYLHCKLDFVFYLIMTSLS